MSNASDVIDNASSRSTLGGHGTASEPSPASTDTTSKFAVVPPLPVLRSAADVYFSDCHNQPYCYFHEPSFRQRLEVGTLPDYLLLAFMATIARFSSDDFFEGRQFQAIGIYARTAWHDILGQAFSSSPGAGVRIDICTVQATNMLAIIDFTGMLFLPLIALQF